jgi:hypothetical protein
MPHTSDLPPGATLEPLLLGKLNLVRELDLLARADPQDHAEVVCFHAARVLEVAVIDVARKLKLDQGRRGLHLRMVDLHDAGFLGEKERNAFVGLRRIGNDARHVKRTMESTDAHFARWALAEVLNWWAEYEAPPVWQGLKQSKVEPLLPPAELNQAFAALCAPAASPSACLFGQPVESWLGGAPVTDDLFALGMERLIDAGDNRTALEQLRRRCEAQGSYIRSRQRELMALAHSRMGQLNEALAALAEIEKQRHERPTEEFAGIYGGVLKRKWLQTQDRADLSLALEKYRLGDPPGEAEDLYCGVNEAACLLWLGRAQEAEAMALKLLAQLARFERISHPRRNRAPMEGSPWRALTQAECHLMAKQLGDSKAIYSGIFKLPGQQGRLESAKVNLLRHLKALELEGEAAGFGL